MAANEPELRLNILVLPNQQHVIVLMLALVVFGTLLAIGYNAPPLLFSGLAIVLFVLSFRQMLVFFETEQRHLGLRQAGETFTPLQTRIVVLAAKLELKRTPLLAIAACDRIPQVIATWNRWYIAIDEVQAQRLQAMLDEQEGREIVDAVLLHELHHFKHGDHLWLEYARALLHIGIRLILWLVLVLMGLVLLLAMVRRSFFTYFTPESISSIIDALLPGLGDDVIVAFFGSVEEYRRVAEQARNTDFGQVLFNIIANTLPYLLIGSLMLSTYWQRLLRLREAYADMGAIQVLGNTRSLIRAMAATWQRVSGEEKPRNLLRQLQSFWNELNQRLNRFYLKPAERVAILQAPEEINGTAWAYGLTIGLFVLGLNLIMSSTAALLFVGQWPMHFPVLATTVLISLYLLTPLALGRPIMRPLLMALFVAIGLHSGMVILSLLLLAGLALFSPITMIAVLEASARSIAWYTRINPTLAADNPVKVLATATFTNLIQIPIIFLLGAGSLWLIARIAGRMFTWYGFPNAEQHLLPKMYQVVGCVVTIVALVLLPPITDLALLRFTQLASLGSPIYWILGLGSLLGLVIFSAHMLRLDHQYAGRCPHCGMPVPGPFALGTCCPHCGAELHAWLGVRYIFWSGKSRQRTEVR